MSDRQLPIILALGTTQTLAWASSYYLPAILADPIARDLGIASNWIFAAFSASMVISALLGPRIGRQIDLVGGRSVLSISNLMLAAGLVLLGFTHSIPVLLVAWLVLGVGMGYGLYDAAFGALGRIYGEAARRSITGITLVAGFASTVGWPLTALGLESIGWRNTCFAWAAAHILIGLPINWLMLPPVAGAKAAVANATKPRIPIDRTMVLLAFAFAAAWTVTSAMAAHFPRIMEAAGATQAQAIAAGALIGPAQVGARIFDAALLSRYHPLLSTRLACLTHPIGAAIVAVAGGGAAWVFAVFHGAGNGVLTISRGTLPLAIFGPQNYAYRPRHHRRTGADGAGSRTAGLRPVARQHGQPHPDHLLRAQSCGAGGALPAARRSSVFRLSGRISPFPSASVSRTTPRWKTRPVRPLISVALCGGQSRRRNPMPSTSFVFSSFSGLRSMRGR